MEKQIRQLEEFHRAYGVAMNTRFNGFGEVESAEVGDAPMASMYGLAPRSIPTVFVKWLAVTVWRKS